MEIGSTTVGQRDECFEQLVGISVGQEDVVVDEKEVPALLGFDLAHDLAYVAAEMPLVKERAGRTELAFETTAPAILEEGDRQVTFAPEQVAPGERSGLRRTDRGTIVRP